MSDTIRAAVIQLSSGQDVEQNLATTSRLCGRAARRGARLLVLPEHLGFVRSLKEKLALAEPDPERSPGPMVASVCRTAAEYGVHVVVGGVPVKSPDEGKFYTTAVVVDPAGRVTATYRKIHLFDVNIPDGAVFTESRWIAAGSEPVVAEAAGQRLGLSICYDLRFPELYRRLVDLGSSILTVSAAFTLHTGKDHWMPLLRARAIENQCFVLAAGQWGNHAPGRVSFGKSCIVDPWGTVLASAPESEGIAVADLDIDYLLRVRRELPCLEHRRADLE